MIVFSQDGYDQIFRYFLQQGCEEGKFVVKRYANKEIYIEESTPVAGRMCLILGSVAPPEINLISMAMLSHTLRKEGAARVVAVLPYMGYARQDRVEVGKSSAMKWVGEVLKISGVDGVWTIDVHSDRGTKLFPIKLNSLSPANIFASQIPILKHPALTIVAPDQGAIGRAKALSAAAGGAKPVCHFYKVRVDGVEHTRLFGAVGKKALIVDDMLDTGATLLSCVNELGKLGVLEIWVAVSHGIFTGSRWEKLFTHGVKKLYCLDSIPKVAKRREPQIQVLPCSQIFSEMIQRLTVQRKRRYHAIEG